MSGALRQGLPLPLLSTPVGTWCLLHCSVLGASERSRAAQAPAGYVMPSPPLEYSTVSVVGERLVHGLRARFLRDSGAPYGGHTHLMEPVLFSFSPFLVVWQGQWVSVGFCGGSVVRTTGPGKSGPSNTAHE